jgi:hypothetical protein
LFAGHADESQHTKGLNEMAEIPVERKGGVPWWVWLLGALLLLALLALLSRGCDTTNTNGNNANPVNNTNRNAKGATSTGAGVVASDFNANVKGESSWL